MKTFKRKFSCLHENQILIDPEVGLGLILLRFFLKEPGKDARLIQ
jgi:hypothetical protein